MGHKQSDQIMKVLKKSNYITAVYRPTKEINRVNAGTKKKTGRFCGILILI
jgi:thiamine biosynthesis lipoprotein ApbE